MWEDHSRIFRCRVLSCGRLEGRDSRSGIASSLGCTKWGRCFAYAIQTDLVPSSGDDEMACSAFLHHDQGSLWRQLPVAKPLWRIAGLNPIHPLRLKSKDSKAVQLSRVGERIQQWPWLQCALPRMLRGDSAKTIESVVAFGPPFARPRTIKEARRTCLFFPTQVSFLSPPSVSRIHSMPGFFDI